MSDDEYTPSTDEVRADYETACTRNHDSYLTGHSLVDAQEVHGARFDRMIESVRAEERERIVRAVEVAQWFVFEDEDVEPDAEFVRRADVDRIVRGEG